MEKRNLIIASEEEAFSEYLFFQLSSYPVKIFRSHVLSDLLLKVREKEADILIIDSAIEGIPNYEIIPLLKKSDPHLPIIALTADSSIDTSQKLRQEGIFFLAMKPVDIKEIGMVMNDVLRMLTDKEQRRNVKMAKVITLPTQEKGLPTEDEKFRRVQEICAQHEGRRGDLLIVLQKIQAVFGYVPEATFDTVSSALGVTRSEIFGVLTFYNRFHLTPRGKHTIRACRGTACHFRGAPSIIQAIKDHLGLRPGKDTTDDFLFSLEEVACLGACGIAPVMTIDEETYGNRTPALAIEAIAKYEEMEEKVAEEKKAA
ncbi:MAG: NAD(P)H-dependent oxidoreductase subunit E [Thermodesulfobacteriota bacterium]